MSLRKSETSIYLILLSALRLTLGRILNYNWKRNDNLPVSVSQLPSGIYNYQFITGDGEVSKGKLVKE